MASNARANNAARRGARRAGLRRRRRRASGRPPGRCASARSRVRRSAARPRLSDGDSGCSINRIHEHSKAKYAANDGSSSLPSSLGLGERSPQTYGALASTGIVICNGLQKYQGQQMSLRGQSLRSNGEVQEIFPDLERHLIHQNRLQDDQIGRAKLWEQAKRSEFWRGVLSIFLG